MKKVLPIPKIGFGTYQAPTSIETTNNVCYAIQNGYRLIDTAARYGNEKEVGLGIKKSKIKRSEIFLTTKLWNTDQGTKSTKVAIEKSLKLLNQNYIDLYLIHWPVVKGKERMWKKLNVESYKVMEQYHKNGKIKKIGVSNFEIKHLKNIIKKCDIVPYVNQIEMHPGLNNIRLIKFCKKHNIKVEAYAPLGHGELMQDPLLIKLAKKYKVSVAQICIRWCLQHNVIPLPKSTHKQRIKDNFNVFKFKISETDMKLIDKNRYRTRIFPDPNKGK